MGDAVIATDGKGIVTFLNPVAEQLIGVSESVAIGRGIQEVLRLFNEAPINLSKIQ
jgi:PAS domain S-box-containing protein